MLLCTRGTSKDLVISNPSMPYPIIEVLLSIRETSRMFVPAPPVPTQSTSSGSFPFIYAWSFYQLSTSGTICNVWKHDQCLLQVPCYICTASSEILSVPPHVKLLQQNWGEPSEPHAHKSDIQKNCVCVCSDTSSTCSSPPWCFTSP